MSKHNRHDPRAKKLPFMMDGPFVARPLEMLESPAFWALSSAGHRFLARLEIEHMRNGGKENGQLILTYDQLEQEKRMHRNSVAPAQRECCALGFVEVTEQGRGGPFKRPNKYRLTYQNVVGHGTYAAASNEWRTIKTIEEALEIAATARRGPAKTATPRKRTPAPMTVTPQDPITVTPPPPSPAPITVTPPGHNYCDSLLYMGKDPQRPGGVPGGQSPPGLEQPTHLDGPATAPPADGPNGHASAIPTTAAAYVAYAKRWIAEATDPNDLTPGRRLGRWDREWRMRNALDPALSDAQRHELRSHRNAMHDTLTGSRRPRGGGGGGSGHEPLGDRDKGARQIIDGST
jgi:hypothetical protein